jgi:hypothetical protein
VVERLLPKQDIVSSSLITRSAEKHRHFELTVFYVSTDCIPISYFLDSLPKSFGTFTEPVVEYLFIRRFKISILSGFESLLVDSFVTRRFKTLIISGLENLLEENFLIRRFNISIFSGLERLFFAVIIHQLLRCAQILIKK